VLTRFTLGCHIGFFGMVYREKAVAQILSVSIPLCYDQTDNHMRLTAARHLKAFKEATNSLKELYQSAAVASATAENILPSALWPYPFRYVCLEHGTGVDFRYIKQTSRLIFFAETVPEGKAICVKFTKTYSKEAHLECHRLGFAPQLLGFDILSGGWLMVVMEDLDAKKFVPLDKIAGTSFIKPAFKGKVLQCHKSGFVHGDIRDTNVLVGPDMETFSLIDFDWSGKEGTVRYPLNVNNVSVRRPAGAEDGELILATHDLQMIDWLP
jgi:hypothetical protein